MVKGLLGGMPPVKRIMAGAAGAAAARIVPGFINRMVPMVPTVGPVGLVVKALGVTLMGGLVRRFMGPQFAEDFTFGGFVVVADEAARAYLYPAVGISGYMDDTATVGAYLNGVGAYLTPGATLPALGGPGGFADINDYGPLSGAFDQPGSRLDSSNRL